MFEWNTLQSEKFKNENSLPMLAGNLTSKHSVKVSKESESINLIGRTPIASLISEHRKNDAERIDNPMFNKLLTRLNLVKSIKQNQENNANFSVLTRRRTRLPSMRPKPLDSSILVTASKESVSNQNDVSEITCLTPKQCWEQVKDCKKAQFSILAFRFLPISSFERNNQYFTYLTRLFDDIMIQKKHNMQNKKCSLTPRIQLSDDSKSAQRVFFVKIEYCLLLLLPSAQESSHSRSILRPYAQQFLRTLHSKCTVILTSNLEQQILNGLISEQPFLKAYSHDLFPYEPNELSKLSKYIRDKDINLETTTILTDTIRHFKDHLKNTVLLSPFEGNSEDIELLLCFLHFSSTKSSFSIPSVSSLVDWNSLLKAKDIKTLDSLFLKKYLI